MKSVVRHIQQLGPSLMRRGLLAILLVFVSHLSYACVAGVTISSAPSGNNLLRYTFTNTSTYGVTLTASDSNHSMIYYGDSAPRPIGKTGAVLHHTYLTTGPKYVMLISDIDSSGTIICKDTAYDTIYVSYPPCGFILTDSVETGRTVFFRANCPAGTTGLSYTWNFGDGHIVTGGNTITHTYVHDSLYNVSVYDTSGSGCSYNNSISLNIKTGNIISGSIFKDTIYMPTLAYYKIWLVQYDSITHIISAIDSTADTGTAVTPYHFNNVVSGQYLVKAAITNSTTGTGFIPTYGSSSTSWSTASVITYDSSGGMLGGQNIYMQHGLDTGTGPGFIGGDVRYGAGKGTAIGDPVVGLLMMLRDVNNNLIEYTYTDVLGNYSFTNLPLGRYGVYPEAIGYTIVAAGGIVISPIVANVANVNFIETSTAILPKPLNVNKINNTHVLEVFPNPASRKVNIAWDDNMHGIATIAVINTIGQKVYTTQIEQNGSGITAIDISELQPDIYFINIDSGDMSYKTKLMIQK